MSLCIIIANIPNKSSLKEKKTRDSVNKDWWSLLWKCHLFQMFTRGGAFLLLRNASAVVPNTPHQLRFALKGIRDISMWDELPPITSLQRWCDIVATLAHYYNVMGDMVRMLCIRRNSTAGIRSPQMSGLIRRSTIKVIELRLPVRGDAGSGVGGRPEGGHLQSLLPLFLNLKWH